MAYVDQSSDFGYGTKLTSTQMQNLRDNLAAFAAQDSGAPEMSAVADASIDQSALKTDTEEESGTIVSGAVNVTLFTFSSVGEYGFYPRTKWSAVASDAFVTIHDTASTTSYVTTIAAQHETGVNRDFYGQIRYVTASGEIFWLYILKDKETGKYIRMHTNPDHPCICCHDPEAVHHPFFDAYKPDQHEILCIPLSKRERAEIEDLREWKNELPGLTFLECIKKYFDIDENPKNAKWPTIPVTIGVDRNRRVIKAKIPKRDYIKQAALIKKK